MDDHVNDYLRFRGWEQEKTLVLDLDASPVTLQHLTPLAHGRSQALVYLATGHGGEIKKQVDNWLVVRRLLLTLFSMREVVKLTRKQLVNRMWRATEHVLRARYGESARVELCKQPPPSELRELQRLASSDELVVALGGEKGDAVRVVFEGASRLHTYAVV